MDDLALRDAVERLVTPFLEGRSVELVDLQLSGGSRRKMLRVYVDTPEGITIGACSELSRGLADLLDTHDPIAGSYVLEVSSPGLVRPLKTERDFRRALGKLIRVVVAGQEPLVGVLRDFGTAHLVLEVDARSVQLARTDIQKANLHFEF